MIKLFLIVLLFLVFPFNFSAAAVAQGHEEHSEQQMLHPCGEPGLDFNGLTGFFQYKWRADFRDLSDRAVQIWLHYHGLQHTEITVVRLFKSPQQPTIGVLHGRRFVNYLDGKPLVDMLCIVKVQDSHVIQYSMDEIEKILNSGGENT